MSHWKHFKSKACSIALGADDKPTALDEVVSNFVAARTFDSAQAACVLTSMNEREALATTGVGMGVAIPHVKLAGLERAVASLSVHRQGLEWGAVDGAPVHLVFAVVRPDRPSHRHDPEQHLQLMQWIARLARHADFRSFALQASRKSQLVELLEEMGGV